jgi:hypothetical protein
LVNCTRPVNVVKIPASSAQSLPENEASIDVAVAGPCVMKIPTHRRGESYDPAAEIWPGGVGAGSSVRDVRTEIGIQAFVDRISRV